MADFDVVIVGSGVAGALCAAGLAAKGHRVLVLEAADNGVSVAQREQFKRVWDTATGKSWNTPYVTANGKKYFPSPASIDVDTYYAQPHIDPLQSSLTTFKGTYQRVLGGSTWAWRGNTPRMMPNDLRLKTAYFSDGTFPDGANVADWPVTYADLQPWYLRAERELGVSGNAAEWESLTPRDGQPFPMPGQPLSYSDKLLISRLRASGLTKVSLAGQDVPLEVLTMAQARNSVPYDGRPACEGNHNCIPLCPTQAKYDATIHLKKALQLGAKVFSGCVVTTLKAEPGGQISEVLYKQWASNDPFQERSVRARVVILAANPIETPKILLASGLYAEDDPNVGKHLMDHVQGECLGVAPEQIFPFRGPQTIAGFDSTRDGAYRRMFASFRITLGNDGWGRHGNPTSVLEEAMNPGDTNSFIIGKKLRHHASDHLSRLVRLSVSTEQLPHRENSVGLSEKLDDLGIPRPKIRYSVHPYTQTALQEGYAVAAKIFSAMGVEVEKPSFDVNSWVTAAHPMGTCRMGTSAADSVVDRYGKCHKHPNLYIAGAAVFPTGAASNPVLTIAALSLMSVDHIDSALRNP